MKRIEQIRRVVADLEVLRTRNLGVLNETEDRAWRWLMAELESLVREERRAQNSHEFPHSAPRCRRVD